VVLGYKIGVLAGSPIFNQKPSSKSRAAAVEGLNNGDLDGMVMMDKVGGCGHNLVGANHMIFMGSLYSKATENQAIGSSLDIR
jgi:SNF2 family DNA or RNA helicase